MTPPSPATAPAADPSAPLPAEVDLLIIARHVVPVVPAGVVLDDHAVVVDGGRIRALLPAARAAGIAARQTVRLDDHVLLPGLVNAHGHAAMTLLRGYADDLPLHRWLEEQIWPAERRWLGAEFVRDGTALAIAEMLRSGTTCFSDMYFFPDVVARTAQDIGMRAHVHFPVIDFPTAWGDGADEYIHKGVALFDEFKHSALVGIGFGPHAPYTVGDAPLARIAMLAAELDASIQMHVHETTREVAAALAASGERPLARLQRLGILGPRTLCVHATALDDGDIDMLRHNNSHVVHCPESNLKLASGFCPIHRLLGAGVNVALGTDGAASNNDLDLFGEMRSAALLAKAVADDAAALPAHAALHMATLGGARALGLDEHIGSLEVGKAADIIAVDVGDIEALPLYRPISQLVYTNSGSRVSHSWIAGKPMLENRRLAAQDGAELRARATYWQQKIGA